MVRPKKDFNQDSKLKIESNLVKLNRLEPGKYELAEKTLLCNADILAQKYHLNLNIRLVPLKI